MADYRHLIAKAEREGVKPWTDEAFAALARIAELEAGIREHRETSLKGGIENWSRGDVKLHALLTPKET